MLAGCHRPARHIQRNPSIDTTLTSQMTMQVEGCAHQLQRRRTIWTALSMMIWAQKTGALSFKLSQDTTPQSTQQSIFGPQHINNCDAMVSPPIHGARLRGQQHTFCMKLSLKTGGAQKQVT